MLAEQLWVPRPPHLKGRLLFPGQQVWFTVGELGLPLHRAAERMLELSKGRMLHSGKNSWARFQTWL